MQTIYPVFYNKFVCVADKCRHSCCKGWEIDIDEATAAKYKEFPGTLGEEIRRNITSRNGIHSFVLTEEDNCPFLQKNGLCKLILSAGEEILCEICNNHPRFYTLLNGYELAGVGLSCEVACEVLLTGDKPLTFCLEGHGETMDFSQLLSMLGINLSSEQLIFEPGLDQSDALEVLDIMGRTEPIDDRWTQEIGQYKEYANNNPDFLADYFKTMPKLSFQKIYEYIMYRQLEKLGEYSLEDVLIYTDISTEYIFVAAAIIGNLPEVLRRWSEQIEYCQENVAMLLIM
ncbi:flagellin lysine-N-methylase [Anaerovibrio sp. RM50]|uniref:flagellin lysine-N-methylase n=1 Tax=Anaerovibrio sp. RM50 TaxID=1200557 RepID=UPI000486F221|nr:flagellin lysine-N-methylase [Anaerovibrio sp. RM50]